jgi:tRNA 2-(methylsulfanyl)-N6-isopentenyladenosine37 hydroxylase
VLGLKRPSSRKWAEAALADPIRILIDHAHCEKKAAASALSLITTYPARAEIVEAMTALAKEELEHFERVVVELRSRGAGLKPDRADVYVNKLRALIRPKEPAHGLDRMLVAALIEARSCERFKILAETSPDAALRTLYRELMGSEASHYATFVNLARCFADKPTIDERLEELLVLEARIVEALGDEATMHG